MRRPLLLAMTVLASLLAGLPAAAQERTSRQALEAARAARLEGRYDEALTILGRLGEVGAPPEVREARARTLAEVGRYQEALDALGGTDALDAVRGEILVRLGRLEEAEAAFRRAASGDGPDRHVARQELGVLLWNRGEREAALEIFDGFIDLYNGAAPGALSAEDLMAVGTAVRYLGRRRPVLLQDALRAYDEAGALAPGDPRPDLLAGDLFLETYNGTDAGTSFREVLQRNPRNPGALLGRARVLDFDGEPGAMEAAREALAVNPRLAAARVFVARLHLRAEEPDRAVEEANRALEVDPNDLEALSVLAAAHFLSGDTVGFRRARDRAAAVNPRYAGLYSTVAELAADQRRYATAVDLAGRAVALDSTSWRALGLLAMNQLRTDALDEGRRNLERAFQGDPYNVWYKNTLDLLDTFGRYETVRTEHFELFIDRREAGLLAPYAERLAEEAWTALVARYGAEPPTPVRVELYPSHADFSVRTLGLVGLGALGVSFGSTLVMDSPSARDAGDFNWASTLWHELAHAFHLAMTDHRVPRWFSEGLAVREQRLARESWGFHVSPAWLQAWRAGRLPPVSRLNEGFVRPDYPEQVPFSYFEASLVFDMIEGRWGFGAVRSMLEGYREGRTTEELVRSVLGLDPEGLDRAFADWIDDRFAERMAAVEPITDLVVPGSASLEELRRQAARHPGSLEAHLALGKALYEAGRGEEALPELREAVRLFPEYGGVDGPYPWLARIHKDRAELELAANALHQLGRHNENVYRAHAEEAELREALGQTEAAARALQKAVLAYPYAVEVHRRLAELLAGLGERDDAVLERRAVVALEPVDEAEARYRLARALLDAGRREEARSEVLRALEIAPNYDEALDLLLEIRGRSR